MRRRRRRRRGDTMRDVVMSVRTPAEYPNTTHIHTFYVEHTPT